jgi:TatD DNase family protein
LNFKNFDDDREEVLDRAREKGIDRILNPGIDIESCLTVIALAEQYQEVYASVGIHPNSAQSWNASSLYELEAMASHPKVVAIGEIGLDYYRDRAPRQLQLDVFQHQLELAAQMNLPVIIHNRQASADIISILHLWCSNLRKMKNPLWEHPGVLHSFSEDEAVAKQAISDNFLIGITGPITFNNTQVIQKAVSNIPPENLLVETDAPFLTPHPYRGTRNEPVHVRLVADKIAQLQGIAVEIIAEKTTTNADVLLNWREIG